MKNQESIKILQSIITSKEKQRFSNENNLKQFNTYKCREHNNYYYKICLKCNMDICPICESNLHLNHQKIRYEEIIPDIFEINNLQKEIKSYLKLCDNIKEEINKWFNNLKEKMQFFEQIYKMNEIINSYDLIMNFNSTKNIICLNTIYRFRKLYHNIIKDSNANNKNKNIFMKINHYGDGNIPLYLNPNEIKNLLQNIKKNKVNTQKESEYIIKYLLLFPSDIININNNYEKYYSDKNYKKTSLSPLDNITSNSLCNKSTGNDDYNAIKENIISDMKAKEYKKLIEKTIITDFNIDKPLTKNPSRNNILNNNKIIRKNFSLSDFTKYLNKMGLTNNKYNLYKSNSSQNLLNKSINSNKSIETAKSKNFVYKKHNNIYKESKSAMNSPKSNQNTFFIFNTIKKDMDKNKYKNDNQNWYNNTLLTDRKTEIKTYIHKKYIYNGNNNNKPNNDLNLTEIKIDNNNNNNKKEIKQKALFINNNNSNEIDKEQKSSIKSINKNNLLNLIYSPTSNRNNSKNNKPLKINKLNLSLNSNQKEILIPSKINKLNKHSPIIINPTKELYIGLELTDTECIISIINQETNEMQLYSFDDDEYSIPLMVSFSENKKEIKIGKDAKNNLLNNPSQTIFNITKFFRKKMKYINYRILPFKIYIKNNEEDKPFIKINFGPQKDKIIYMENILSIYLQKLFVQFFNKIKLELNKNINNPSIKVILAITVPNHFSYYQRKLIERIFRQEVIPRINNDKNINLNLEKIYTVNTSDVIPIGLNISTKIKNNNINNNILVIKIDKESSNISLISKEKIKEKIFFKIKANNGMEKGTNNILNDFIMYILNNKLDIEIKNEILKSPLAIIKIINLCKKIILNLSESDKTKLNLNEILSENNNNIIIDISLKEYENFLYNHLYDLKQLINKMIENYGSNLKININEIILIGEIFKNENIKSEIKKFLKQKNLISEEEINIINADINKEYYTINGAVYYAMNIRSNIKLLQNICQYNIGIKTYNDSFHYLVKKGYIIPFKNKEKIKIGKTSELNLYEEDSQTKEKILIAKYDIKNNINNNEIIIEYELNEELNFIIKISNEQNFYKKLNDNNN